MPERETLEVDGHRLKVSNLGKVLYPGDGTTKHQVIEHYVGVADVLLPQLAGRPATRKRWPDGTAKQPFFEKNTPRGTPSWVRTVTLDSPGSTRDREQVTYPVVESLAALVWLANLAALELHTPQWTVGPRGGVRHPDRLVVDLDPGAPAGLAECAEVACLVRERLAAAGLETYPVTSGSKGLQLYAPISGKQDADVVRHYAHEMAKELEAAHPRLVVSRMAKAVRGGKVFLDWSQNDDAKTTITPYSLRGLDRPFVAAPRTWYELAEPGSLRQLVAGDIPDRLEQLGDLSPPTGGSGPRLP
jgi:bifunctional non-homologous end joining protein LigD